VPMLSLGKGSLRVETSIRSVFLWGASILINCRVVVAVERNNKIFRIFGLVRADRELVGLTSRLFFSLQLLKKLYALQYFGILGLFLFFYCLRLL
jgi:hypothetical protein